VPRPPILSDDDIAWLLEIPKLLGDGTWRQRLVPRGGSGNVVDRRSRIELEDIPDGGRLGGRFHVYARENLSAVVLGDWSVGLVYADYSEPERSYPVIRCNGPHPSPHPNVIEGDTIIRHAHVHYLTERYQRIRKPDGFAEPTTAYTTMQGALDHLVSLANLQASGMLFP
jgi:hypothetical protein